MTLERAELRFRSAGDECAAWLYRTDGPAPSPCVVMAHGFSLTRHDGLPAYAERLARAGATVLVFDHRYLGDSGGAPRQRVAPGDARGRWRGVAAAPWNARRSATELTPPGGDRERALSLRCSRSDRLMRAFRNFAVAR